MEAQRLRLPAGSRQTITLPFIPPPPVPLGVSGRVRHRYRRTVELNNICIRVISCLNLCAGSHSVCTPLEHATAREPARIVFSDVAPEVVDCWLHVVSCAKRVREGRRLSTESFGTGDALLTRLRKSLCDVYERLWW